MNTELPNDDDLREILERYFPDSARTGVERSGDISDLKYAKADAPIISLQFVESGDPKAFSKLLNALISVRRHFGRLSFGPRATIEREYWHHLSTLNSEDSTHPPCGPDPSKLLDAMEAACRKAEPLFEASGRPTGHDKEAAAIVEECRRIWRLNTGDEAPKSTRGSLKQPINEHRSTQSFRQFATEVFEAHGLKHRSVDGGLDALRAIKKEADRTFEGWKKKD